MPITDELGYMWCWFDGFLAKASIRHGFAMAGSSSTLRQNLMDQWLTTVLPIILPVMADTWDVARLFWQDVVPGTAAEQDYVGLLNQRGGSFADPLPGQNAMITTWFSDLTGRANRGRTYWPGLSTAFVQSGIVKSTATNAAGDYAEAMLDAFTPRVAPPFAQFGTISKQLDGVPRGPVLIETTSFQVRNDFGERRSRRTTFGP